MIFIFIIAESFICLHRKFTNTLDNTSLRKRDDEGAICKGGQKGIYIDWSDFVLHGFVDAVCNRAEDGEYRHLYTDGYICAGIVRQCGWVFDVQGTETVRDRDDRHGSFVFSRHDVYGSGGTYLCICVSDYDSGHYVFE